MSEFMFRNLSIKLFPVEGEEPGACADRTTCVPCTHLCTGTIPVCDQACTQVPSIPIAVGPECRGPGTSPEFIDTHGHLILPAGDARTELLALKENLQRRLALVEVGEQRLAAAAKPTSVEEIDRLKAHLLDAVAELDEQRARMQAGEPAPDQDEPA